jgi:hypothetical protein
VEGVFLIMRSGRDEDIEQAIHLFQQTYQQSLSRPSPFYKKEEDFRFRLGLTISKLNQGPWPDAIKHYLWAIQFARPESICTHILGTT